METVVNVFASLVGLAFILGAIWGIYALSMHFGWGFPLGVGLASVLWQVVFRLKTGEWFDGT